MLKYKSIPRQDRPKRDRNPLNHEAEEYICNSKNEDEYLVLTNMVGHNVKYKPLSRKCELHPMECHNHLHADSKTTHFRQTLCSSCSNYSKGLTFVSVELVDKNSPG